MNYQNKAYNVAVSIYLVIVFWSSSYWQKLPLYDSVSWLVYNLLKEKDNTTQINEKAPLSRPVYYPGDY